MTIFRAVLLCGAFALAGCAANVTSDRDQKPITVAAGARTSIVVNMDGSQLAKGSSSWNSLTSAFQDGCSAEASATGVPIKFSNGSAHVTGQDGTLVSLYVNDFRYISKGMRIGFGIMTGNAFIDAKATFVDMRSGDVWGDRSYQTKSSAMQGIFSAMTAEQAQAICKSMVDVVSGAEGGSSAKSR
jgi:hypothetical protein